MLKKKSVVEETKLHISNGDINNDILTYNSKYKLDFSDLDKKSKNKLIKEVCKRILRLEQDKQK